MEVGDKLFATFWGISSHSISLFHLLPLLEQTIRGSLFLYIMPLLWCKWARTCSDGSAASPEAFWFAASWKHNTNIAALWASHHPVHLSLAPCLEVLLISKRGAKDVYSNHAVNLHELQYTHVEVAGCAPSAWIFCFWQVNKVNLHLACNIRWF